MAVSEGIMAEEKTTSAVQAPEETTPKPSAKPAKPAPSHAARIVKRVKSAAAGTAAAPSHPAGTYEVVHGRVNLGYEHPRDKDGTPLTHVKMEAVYAHPGEHISLGAEEASALVADGTIRLVATAA